MGELLARFDKVSHRIDQGRIILVERRDELEMCREREAEAKTEYAIQSAKALLTAASEAEPLPGMSRPLADIIKAKAAEISHPYLEKLETMSVLAKSAQAAWQDTRKQLKGLEDELMTIQAMAHAYNRELKTLGG